jgi:cell division protein FtsZ
MSIKLQLPKLADLKPRLTVIGVGGAGCNAINNMIAAGLNGVDFVVANTDAQALAASSAEHRLQLGVNLTEGLGAGSKPEIGEAAAEETVEDIRSQIAGSHMVFIAAGMGGGTGTGAAAVIARVAKELGILTVGIVTKPFHFEGVRRMRTAEAGIGEIRKHVDTLIVIPNQNLFRVANEKTTFAEAFVLADQILYSGVACIVDLIIKEGLIKLDFADVRTIMSGMGSAVMGTGEASGENRASAAAEEAVANPLLDDVSLKGAKGLLLSITGGSDLTLYEVDEAASRVRQEVDPEANIIVGATFDDNLGDRVRVSIVASGMTRISETPGAGNPAEMRMPQAPKRPAMQPMPGLPGADPMPARYPEPIDHDLHQRLTDAIGYNNEQRGYNNEQRMQPTLQPQAHQPHHAPREPWRAPGDVVIEEGFSHMTWLGHQPAHAQAPPHEVPPQVGQQFTPAPPIDVRRTRRRMPDVEDFPPLAQREYHAKAGYGSEPPPIDEAGYDADDEPRRGLLQRIMGRARREADEDSDRSESTFDKLRRLARSPVDQQGWWDDSGARRSGAPAETSPQDQALLPVVFNRLRK